MVVYKLACASGHSFEGWYASLEAYERQAASSRIECPACGSAEVRKLPSAPYVNTGAAPRPHAQPPEDEGAQRKALQALKSYILTNTENVGRQFPEVARRIHYGEEANRGIRGQVTTVEAEEMREEGIPAYPLHPSLRVDEVH